MSPLQNLIVTHSETGLTADYVLQDGAQYSAHFTAVDDLLKGLAEARITIVNDNRLVKKQLKAHQDVATAVHATTSDRLLKAGFVKVPMAA